MELTLGLQIELGGRTFPRGLLGRSQVGGLFLKGSYCTWLAQINVYFSISDYPYPLLSDRARKPLFYETGHTIMNLLTDMRNFTYTLPAISGCTVALDDDKTVILIPMDQYNQVS